MITNFKIFENINLGGLMVGDYVVLNPSKKNWIPFTYSNKIGKVISKHGVSAHNIYLATVQQYEIDIEFDFEITEWQSGRDKLFDVSIDFIKYWSKSREELKLAVAADKYNL